MAVTNVVETHVKVQRALLNAADKLGGAASGDIVAVEHDYLVPLDSQLRAAEQPSRAAANDDDIRLLWRLEVNARLRALERRLATGDRGVAPREWNWRPRLHDRDLEDATHDEEMMLLFDT